MTQAENTELAAVRRKLKGKPRSPPNHEKGQEKTGEKWKPVVITKDMVLLDPKLAPFLSYNTGWQISNAGRVRNKGGQTRKPKPTSTSDGYARVSIRLFCTKGAPQKGKRRTRPKYRSFRVSRLVGFAFLGEERKEDQTTIDHNNRKRHDDHETNLGWATPAEQAANRGPRRRGSGRLG